MSSSALTIENVWKEYRIHHQFEPHGASLKQLLNTPYNRVIGLFRKEQQAHDERFWALRDVSFHVEHGESVGLIGRNGAGKSTLLKILSRITRPTRGRVILHEKVSSLLEIGTGFNSELSGRDNVFLNGAFLGMKSEEIRRRFDEIIAFSEIEQFIDTPVKYYSSGMYVRLAFSVAAHLTPEILLLDEVLAVGDAGFQQKSREKMLELIHSGATIILVSHSDAVIRQVCKRAIWLDKGRLQDDGPADQVTEAYLKSMA